MSRRIAKQIWNGRQSAEHESNERNSAQRAQLGHELRPGDDGHVRFIQLEPAKTTKSVK